MIWLLALALPAVAVLAYVAADAARNVARLVRDAAARWRRARDDDPFDEACALTGPAPDPTPLPADFLMWQQELESTS